MNGGEIKRSGEHKGVTKSTAARVESNNRNDSTKGNLGNRRRRAMNANKGKSRRRRKDDKVRVVHGDNGRSICDSPDAGRTDKGIIELEDGKEAERKGRPKRA